MPGKEQQKMTKRGAEAAQAKEAEELFARAAAVASTMPSGAERATHGSVILVLVGSLHQTFNA